MLKYILLALLCFTVFFTACSPSHDGEVLWKFEAKKAHPKWVAGDEHRLYLAADDVYCLAKDTGDLLWEFETLGSHSSAPLLVGERLFFQCGGLYALDASTGRLLWEFWTKHWAEISPLADAERVYASAGNQLYCLDAGTGKRLWSVKTGPLKKTPVLIGARFFFNQGKTIFCLDASSGKVVWRFKIGDDITRIASAGNYLLSADFEGSVRAHLIETGKVQWQFNAKMSLVDLCVAPIGRVLISADALYCLDLETGAPLWTFDQDQGFVFNRIFDVQGYKDYAFARCTTLGYFCVAMNDGSLIRRLRLPNGAILLKGIEGTIFFSGGKRRELSCLSLSVL